ncbi:hypothetical protein FK85_05505 [Halorubrum saccharovorum]|uniref:Uncharacterized protein n=1 Tax=Halorubrum saccharovorum TaxID=2248 RepID=A0A081EUU4_9EURY|nr:hypothetical protein [Halorubrum saccharovorum]KDS91182.1 hypothetical protein FK85_05505 [Halorubrum saccharovorum]
MSTHETGTRTQTTVDLAELGFEADADVEVAIEERDDATVVEAAHDTGAWTLTFDQYGELDSAPAGSPPRWLGPVIKKAAPQLRVV